MSITFRFAHRCEYPRISRFIDEYWAHQHVYVRSRALFDWTFTRPGYTPAEEYSFALAEDGNEIIGILGGIPHTFNKRGEARPAVWIVNYAIRPDYRKGTAALKLLSMFRNPSYPVVIASGLNPSTVAIYQVLHGVVFPETPRHLMVLPDATARMAALVQAAGEGVGRERAMQVARAFSSDAGDDAPNGCASKLPADWDGQNWRAIAAETVGAARDADYLSWRYLQHPSFHYEFITLPEGARTGLLIWRLETIRMAGSDGLQDFDRLGRVVEFLPVSAANARGLTSLLRNRLRQMDAMGADCYQYHGATRTLLTECGFLDTASVEDGTAIPSRFQPLTVDAGTLNAMFCDPDLPPCNSGSGCSWYWTKSDSDQDRPN